MIILVRKAWRDLKQTKMRTASIILAIMLSVGLGISMVNATENAMVSFDKRTELTNYEDISIQFDDAEVDISTMEAMSGVDKAIGRLLISTQVKIGETRYETDWISAPYHDVKPHSEINGYQFLEGEYVSSPTARECLVGNLFAKEHGLGPGDGLEIQYNNRSIMLEITGIVASPEYIYVIGEGGWPQPSLLLPLFTTYEMTVDATGIESGTFNELLVIVENGHEPEDVSERLEATLTSDGLRITRSLLGTEEADYQFSRVDAKAMGQIGWAFGFIILCVTAVVIYNSLTRLIASQRPYIGVMGALGGRTRKILLHYSLFGFFMGLLGSLFGIVLGIALSKMIVYLYADLIGLVNPDTTIYWIYPLVFSVIGVAISTLAALIGSLRVTRIGPREALTSQYNTQVFSKKPIIEKLFDRSSKKRSILTRVPLRNLGRNKVRTGITIVAMAFSLILVFACLVMAFCFTQPLYNNYEEYEKWDMKAALTERQNPDSLMATLDELDDQDITGEAHIDDFMPVLHDDELEYVHIQAFKEDSLLRSFNVIDGKDDLRDGVLVGSILAKDLELSPGDKITFVMGETETEVEVVGITGELLDDSVFMTFETATEVLGFDAVANSMILDIGDHSRSDAEQIIQERFSIASVSYTDDIVDGMEKMMQGMISMFMVFILFGVIAEILFVSTTVVLNILDRDMEFISLRAIGCKAKRIRRMIVSESLILLGFGLLIGLPLGYYITIWAFDYIIEDMMFIQLEISLFIYVVTAVIALASAVLASYISGRHITKMCLADAIRQRSIS